MRAGDLALLGDAAHTAHFSIGSGTKLAMEDAIALSNALRDSADLPAALTAYEQERKPIVERFQRAAQESLTWFEHVRRYTYARPATPRTPTAEPERPPGFEPLQLAVSLLTRSRKVSYDNLKLRDPAF